MPNLNQTGPMGIGTMTDRRFGRCNCFSGAHFKNHLDNGNPLPPKDGFRGREMRCESRNSGRGMGRQNRFRGGF